MLSSLKDQDFLLIDKENLNEIFKDLVFQDSFCRKLETFLPSKRWYSAKDDTIAAVSFQALIPLKTFFGGYSCRFEGRRKTDVFNSSASGV